MKQAAIPVVPTLLAVAMASAASVSAETIEATYPSVTTIPVTAPAFTASGSTLKLDLQVAVPTGTDLTVINNTGLDFIQGTFDNLPQGMEITLKHEGITYRFVANYHAGTGNDLVLQWANTRLLAWGDNYQGKLGNNSALSSPTPAPVDMSGVLAGRTIVSVASGAHHNLVLCSDGTLAAWGDNLFSQLGVERISKSMVPVAVDRTGALAGKTVIAISASKMQSAALCADGTVITWGWNMSGNLGNNTIGGNSLPVAVDQSGVLAGKTVTDISIGGDHAIVLCSDGTMATWGANGNGELGADVGKYTTAPVLVDRSGALAGKTVTAISTRGQHNLALCSDGTLVAWGFNLWGQLGNNSTRNATAPVRVNQIGVLYRKTITAISAGTSRSLVLTASGALAAWGDGNGGQLGNNRTEDSHVPVLVDRTGALRNTVVSSIASGHYHSLAFAPDLPLATWGGNSKGQLGYATESWFSAVPRELADPGLHPGERFVPRSRSAGQDHTIAVVASPPAPDAAVTEPATNLNIGGATLNGRVAPNGSVAEVLFEYGTSTEYGSLIDADPSTVTGTDLQPVSAALSGLQGDTTYHSRVVAKSAGGVIVGEDRVFSTSVPLTLEELECSHGTLRPEFTPSNTRYTLTVSNAVDQLTLTPTVGTAGGTITINGNPAPSGTSSPAIPLEEGANIITVRVADDDANVGHYVISATRLPATFTFSSSTSIGATVGSLAASGNHAAFHLDFAPPPGTNLVVVENTGLQPIGGTFENLAQGQSVILEHAGIQYPFVVNYFGGNGNDLVLQWANQRILGWGAGPNHTQAIPTPVDLGILSGKTVIQTAVGRFFGLAVCSDGTVAAWGDNQNGTLGNNTTDSTSTPVAVDQSGVLKDKFVVAVAAGSAHALALCSDGTVAAWGINYDGQLGVSGTIKRPVPVMVYASTALAERHVIAVAAGSNRSLALCSDGTLASWGKAPLGHASMDGSTVPVAVDQSGAMAGKTVQSIAVGASHALALCADGTVAAWGGNYYGQLGIGTSVRSYTPVLVDRTGILAGKSVTAIAAGGLHNLVLCRDGTVAAWGVNSLGNGDTVGKSVPVPVDQSGVLSAKSVTSVAAGAAHSLALCSDGTLASWGENSSRQLGKIGITNSTVAVRVNTDELRPGERFSQITTGPNSDHSLALVASPPPPVVETLPATDVSGVQVTLNGKAHPNGSITDVFFEYGLSEAYGMIAPAAPASVNGNTPVTVSTLIDGLTPGTGYHYRIVARNSGGTIFGEDQTFLANTTPVFTVGFPASIDVPPAANPLQLDLSAFAFDPDPDDHLVWEVVSVSLPGLFRSLDIDPSTGALNAIYNPWASGSSELVFKITDSFGSTAETTTSFRLPPHPLPTITASDKLAFNRQTGLYEHTIAATNSGLREIAGFDLTIAALPESVVVQNAPRPSVDGTTIQHRKPLAAGSTVTLVLEYFAPIRGTTITPDITVTLVPEPEGDPVAPGEGIAVDRCMAQPDGSMLIEFSSTPDTLYEILYSDDGTTWKLSPTRIRAGGDRVQWIDRGPPRTEQAPVNQQCRFYRVRSIPESSDKRFDRINAH